MRIKSAILGVGFLLCGFILIVSCDQTFHPLKENNQYSFTIAGYLDASADTQWVRVGTIRHSINEPPDPTNIKVTLEDLQSGETVAMNDSVFVFKNVLNYWTTMDIEDKKTYKIAVNGIEGKTSTVTLKTPTKIPSVYITLEGGNSFFGNSTRGARIYIDDSVEHIADLQSVWYVIIHPGTENLKRIYKFSLRNTLTQTNAFFGGYTGFANWDRELRDIEESVGGAEISVVTRQFFVAAGGPEWIDDISSINNLEYFLDGTASNVENGLGYVVGINSSWFRQVTCLKPDRSNFAPCNPEEPYWYDE